MKKNLFLFILLTLFTACSDDATIIKNKKALHNLDCMHLVVFPPDKLITQTLLSLYNFDTNCSYRLEVSRKSGILCNSNQNADKKALTNFPSGYIRMDLYKGSTSVYSYYKDLTHKASKDDIEDAFQRLQKDLLEK